MNNRNVKNYYAWPNLCLAYGSILTSWLVYGWPRGEVYAYVLYWAGGCSLIWVLRTYIWVQYNSCLSFF